MPPKSEGVLESSLYVDSVAVSARFYEKVFGFRVISDFGGRGCAMQAGDRQILLLFKKGGSRSIQSPHDGDGELHLAFGIPASELGSWDAACRKRNLSGREAHVGVGWPERLFSRPGPPSDRNRYTGCLVDLLT
jgi:catechol 2,3-dioxygenase-like lactoylglutathione lyase family enzyme